MIPPLLPVLWLAVAAVGVGVQAGAVLLVLADRRFRRDMGWDDAVIVAIARAHLRTAVSRLVVVTVNVGIGIGALFMPAAWPCGQGPVSQQIFGTAVALALIANETQLVVSTVLDRRVRRRVTLMVHAPEPGGTP